jgi:hypothetical protein
MLTRVDDAQLVWSAVGVSATIAGVLAAIVSAGTVFFLRRRDRPEPDWIFSRLGVPLTASLAAHFQSNHAGKDPDFLIMVTNAGDGQAFQVEAAGLGSDVELFIRDEGDARGWRVPVKLARVQPTEEFGILIWFHPLHPQDSLGIRLRWLHAPVRHGRYGERELFLAHPEPEPRRNLLAKLWRRLSRADRAT